MKLHIAGQDFDSEEIRELSIREQQREVFVTTQDDFFRIKYRSKNEIEDAYYWKELSNITFHDLNKAVFLIITVCDYFINSKEQCTNCPLRKKYTKCIFSTIPNNWR